MNFKLLKLGSNTSLLIKIGTITINTFLPTRSKFVYFCSIKTSASGFNKVQDLNKHFLPPAGYVSIFHTKSCLDAGRSCSQLTRDQVNMADAAKLCSPLHSTSDALVVWHGQVLLWRRIGPFLWPVSAAGVAIFSASHWFAEHISHMYWFCQDSEGCSGLDQQQTTKQWPWPSFFFFGASLALGSASELLLSPTTELVITGCHIKNPLFITGCNLVKKWFVVVAQKRRRHFKTTIFLICGEVRSRGTLRLFHLSSSLQMPDNLRMIDIEFFSNFLCSCKKIPFDDGSQLVTVNLQWWLSIGSCQLAMARHHAPHLQGSHPLCRNSWTTPALYAH